MGERRNAGKRGGKYSKRVKKNSCQQLGQAEGEMKGTRARQGNGARETDGGRRQER